MALVQISSFPTEILFEIFAHCIKEDLKALRLVCRLWADVAIPYLYDCIYISSRPQDLGVFSNWIENDLYRKAVKALILDSAKTTTQISLAAFVDAAFTSIVCIERPRGSIYSDVIVSRIGALIMLIEGEEGQRFEMETSQAALAYAKLIGADHADGLNEYKGLVEAFQAFKRLPVQQRDLENTREFERLLMAGLRGLKNLVAVTCLNKYCSLTHYWRESDHATECCPRGPPFLRSWPINLRSLTDRWSPFIREDDGSRSGSDQYGFLILTRACYLSGQSPRALVVSESRIPFQLFDMSSSLARSNSMTQRMWDVYSSLGYLHLEIDATLNSESYLEPLLWVSGIKRAEKGLNACLAKIRDLRYLHLDFRNIKDQIIIEDGSGAIPPWVNFDAVFSGFDNHWPRLADFSVVGVVATDEGLRGFLETHLEQHVIIGDVGLEDGETWASTLTEIYFGPRLFPPTKNFAVVGPLWEGSSTLVWRTAILRFGAENLRRNIDGYVRFGGDHPLDNSVPFRTLSANGFRRD
ncbi:hypothetical protein MMC14_007265 [Varicellaria rhodocarpa]|nr:hypothetical protein [Varicellaria rhodocarpa]